MLLQKTSNPLLILFWCVFGISCIKNETVVLKIPHGTLLGREAKTVDTNKPYYAFQGIPYAEPPIGKLRFAAPVPAKPWSGTLEALKDKSECVQDLFKIEGSEDCLYINVFTPNISNTSDLPVMVWIYGGYFIRGSSNIKNFGPDYLLDENVVVVTFNYRVGLFGFLSTEDMAAPGNFGLKDQILALKWVQKNIHAFGGDPKNVTVFGESAGSGSVSYLLQTPLTKGLFKGAIMQSGNTLSPWSLSRGARASAFAIGAALGIFTHDSHTLIERLRMEEVTHLQSVGTTEDLAQVLLTNPLNGLILAPVVEPPHEGAVVLDRSYGLLKSGNFNRVPCIIGVNSQEGNGFAGMIKKLRLYMASFDIFPERLVPADMNVNQTSSSKVAQLIKQEYFGLTPVGLAGEKLRQFLSDDLFTRATNETVKLRSKHAHTYYYIFSYQGELGNDNKTRSVPGVGHAEDLNYIWNVRENIKNPPKSDLLVRKRLVKLWTNFAKTSNPTPIKDALLEDVIWPLASPNKLSYLNIGANLAVQESLETGARLFWDNLYQTYGNPPYDTY